MGPKASLLLFFFLAWTAPLQGQQHHLVEYMERRLAALEVRDSCFSSSLARGDSTSIGATGCQGPESDKIGLCKKCRKVHSLLVTDSYIPQNKTIAQQINATLSPRD